MHNSSSLFLHFTLDFILFISVVLFFLLLTDFCIMNYYVQVVVYYSYACFLQHYIGTCMSWPFAASYARSILADRMFPGCHRSA